MWVSKLTNITAAPTTRQSRIININPKMLKKKFQLLSAFLENQNLHLQQQIEEEKDHMQFLNLNLSELKKTNSHLRNARKNSILSRRSSIKTRTKRAFSRKSWTSQERLIPNEIGQQSDNQTKRTNNFSVTKSSKMLSKKFHRKPPSERNFRKCQSRLKNRQANHSGISNSQMSRFRSSNRTDLGTQDLNFTTENDTQIYSPNHQFTKKRGLNIKTISEKIKS